MGTLAIAWARKSFPKITVVYVADHHKNYDHCWFELIEELRTEARIYGVHFLENDEVTIDGVRFLGATPWTPFKFNDPSRKSPKSGIATPKPDLDLINTDLEAAKQDFEVWQAQQMSDIASCVKDQCEIHRQKFSPKPGPKSSNRVAALFCRSVIRTQLEMNTLYCFSSYPHPVVQH